MLGNEGMIQRGRGLVDLIAGVTPTLSNWTNDPTDGADITDGDISTFCTTGDLAAAAWEYAYFEWDLGAFYDILLGGAGNGTADAGVAYVNVTGWNGAAWIGSSSRVGSSGFSALVPTIMKCSKVRLGITSNAIATITPNIREFHAWRI